MTDQREKVTVETTDGAVTGSQQSNTPSISRRALVRGASVVVPTILTLNSNAAFGWAITSGTIGTRAANTGAETGDAVCVIGQETKPGVYVVEQSDLVEMPGNYRYQTDSVGLNAEQACEASGQLTYSTDGGTNWNPATAPGGAVASIAATQASSFSTVQTSLFPDL